MSAGIAIQLISIAQWNGFASFQAVIGESAGSASVSMHMLSDQSKDLFHKAIMMSGTAFSPWSLSVNGSDLSQRLAKKLGWNGEGGEPACLRILEKASTHAIVRAQEKLLTTEEYKQVKFIAFSPVLEPYESAQCFLRKHPSELIASAWSKHVPTLIGVCANEGLLFYKSNIRLNKYILMSHILLLVTIAIFEIKCSLQC